MHTLLHGQHDVNCLDMCMTKACNKSWQYGMHESTLASLAWSTKGDICVDVAMARLHT